MLIRLMTQLKAFFRDAVVIVAIGLSLGLIASYMLFGPNAIGETSKRLITDARGATVAGGTDHHDGEHQTHQDAHRDNDRQHDDHTPQLPGPLWPRNYVVDGSDDRAIARALMVINQAHPGVTWTFGTEANVHIVPVNHMTYRYKTGTRPISGLAILTSPKNIRIKLVRHLGSRRWIVAVHEFAHATGVLHTDAPCSMMNPTITFCAQAVAQEALKVAAQTGNRRWLQCVWTVEEKEQFAHLYGSFRRFRGCTRMDRMRQRLVRNEQNRIALLKSQLGPK